MLGVLVGVWVSKANSSNTLQSKGLLGFFSRSVKKRWVEGSVLHSRIKQEGPGLSLRKDTGPGIEIPRGGSGF